MLAGMWKKGKPVTLLGMQTGTATLESIQVPQKVENRATL